MDVLVLHFCLLIYIVRFVLNTVFCVFLCLLECSFVYVIVRLLVSVFFLFVDSLLGLLRNLCLGIFSAMFKMVLLITNYGSVSPMRLRIQVL